jgi:hypothetical protein
MDTRFRAAVMRAFKRGKENRAAASQFSASQTRSAKK